MRLLRRSDFDLVLCRDLVLPEAGSEAFDGLEPGCLAVIDAGDLIATLEFVRLLRLEQRTVHLLVLLPRLEDSIASGPLLRMGVKGVLTYEQRRRANWPARPPSRRRKALGSARTPDRLRGVDPAGVRGCEALDCAIKISRREREVLDLLLENLSNKEIAARLFISERTVKFHVSNLLSKFNVQRRADLIVLWMQRTSTFPWLAREADRTISARVH